MGPAGPAGPAGANGVNGRNGTDYPYPLFATLTRVSSTPAYIQVDMVNASNPGVIVLKIEPNAPYSATWTTIDEVDLSEPSTGNMYVTTTVCSNTPNGFCYISGGANDWAFAFSGILAFERGRSFTLTLNGLDSTGASLVSTYTITF
jgi:hypothetical protein